jgi:hypothetical protein
MAAVVGTALAAGSAMASVTVDFNGVTTSGSVETQLSPSSYGGFAWGGDTEVLAVDSFNGAYGGAGWSGFTGNIAYNGNDLGASTPISATWGGSGTSISLESIAMGKVWPNIGGFASSEVTIKGFKNSVEVASQIVALTGSTQSVSLTGGFADIDTFTMVGSAGGGYFYFGSFTYSVVPAPGAIALLGAAGLVGSRRRR